MKVIHHLSFAFAFSLGASQPDVFPHSLAEEPGERDYFQKALHRFQHEQIAEERTASLVNRWGLHEGVVKPTTRQFSPLMHAPSLPGMEFGLGAPPRNNADMMLMGSSGMGASQMGSMFAPALGMDLPVPGSAAPGALSLLPRAQKSAMEQHERIQHYRKTHPNHGIELDPKPDQDDKPILAMNNPIAFAARAATTAFAGNGQIGTNFGESEPSSGTKDHSGQKIVSTSASDLKNNGKLTHASTNSTSNASQISANSSNLKKGMSEGVPVKSVSTNAVIHAASESSAESSSSHRHTFRSGNWRADESDKSEQHHERELLSVPSFSDRTTTAYLLMFFQGLMLFMVAAFGLFLLVSARVHHSIVPAKQTTLKKSAPN